MTRYTRCLTFISKRYDHNVEEILLHVRNLLRSRNFHHQNFRRTFWNNSSNGFFEPTCMLRSIIDSWRAQRLSQQTAYRWLFTSINTRSRTSKFHLSLDSECLQWNVMFVACTRDGNTKGLKYKRSLNTLMLARWEIQRKRDDTINYIRIRTQRSNSNNEGFKYQSILSIGSLWSSNAKFGNSFPDT